MSKVTIITGAPASGKTKKARQMVEGKKAFWVQNISENYIRGIPGNTEVIVIDGLSRVDLAQLKSICTCGILTFRKPYSDEVIKMKTPEIIATTNLEFPEEEVRRFNVIRL